MGTSLDVVSAASAEVPLEFISLDQLLQVSWTWLHNLKWQKWPVCVKTRNRIFLRYEPKLFNNKTKILSFPAGFNIKNCKFFFLDLKWTKNPVSSYSQNANLIFIIMGSFLEKMSMFFVDKSSRLSIMDVRWVMVDSNALPITKSNQVIIKN